MTVLFADVKGSMELLRARRGELDGAAADLAAATGMLQEMDMRSWLARAQAVAPGNGPR